MSETPDVRESRGGQAGASIEPGQVWRVRSSDEHWLIVSENHDGAGAYNVALLGVDHQRTSTTDAVWGAELRAGAELVAHPCRTHWPDDCPADPEAREDCHS